MASTALSSKFWQISLLWQRSDSIGSNDNLVKKDQKTVSYSLEALMLCLKHNVFSGSKHIKQVLPSLTWGSDCYTQSHSLNGLQVKPMDTSLNGLQVKPMNTWQSTDMRNLWSPTAKGLSGRLPRLKRNRKMFLACRVRVFQHRLEPDELTAKHLAMLGSATLVLVHSVRQRYSYSNTVAGAISIFGHPMMGPYINPCFSSVPSQESSYDSCAELPAKYSRNLPSLSPCLESSSCPW